MKEQGLKLKAVLLTHAHFDHIMGLSDVMEDIKVPVYVEEADLPMMMDGESNLSSGDPYTGAYTGRMLLLYGTGRCSF